MEQNIQQAAENKLPIKTKIAAWWMVILGFFLLLPGLVSIGVSYHNCSWLGSPSVECWAGEFLILLSFFIILPEIIFLKFKKNWSWAVVFIKNIVVLIILIIGYLLVYSYGVILGDIILLILLSSVLISSSFSSLTARTSGKWRGNYN